ncbi:MAG: hypothetical protein U5K29_09870 [Acidimicrobiales bacterium]|nr:hypothetical protein [Acidimicrobiales bacterium]
MSMSATAPDPEVLRPAAIGAAIGFVVITLAVTIGGSAGGIEPGAALGLGLFTGMWAGAGFGFMMGATLPLARHMDAAERNKARPTPASTDSGHETKAA